MNDIAKGVIKNILTNEKIYDDALHPAAQETGKTLALIPQTINAALLPLRMWIAGREKIFAKFQEQLNQKFEYIDPKKITTPEAYIAVPTIQTVLYTIDNKVLSDMYANLLAKSMYIDTKNQVSPAFIEVIKQMSPIDADIFNIICERINIPLVNLFIGFPTKQAELPQSFNHYKIPTEYDKTKIIAEHISDIDKYAYSETIFAFSNLERLGLIKLIYDKSFKDELYNDIFNSNLFKQLKTDSTKYISDTNEQLDFQKGYIEITPFGHSFCKICISPIKS